jgi:ketosteroid isomerase-like protein
VSDLLEELAAKSAVQDLATRYAIACDRKEWDTVVGLFTPDGVFDAEAVYGRTMRGSAELRSFFDGAPVAAGHHPTNVLTTLGQTDRAGAVMKMIVLFRSGIFSVDYTWRLARVEGDWRIEHQRIGVVGKVSLPTP